MDKLSKSGLNFVTCDVEESSPFVNLLTGVLGVKPENLC